MLVAKRRRVLRRNALEYRYIPKLLPDPSRLVAFSSVPEMLKVVSVAELLTRAIAPLAIFPRDSAVVLSS